MDWWTVGVALGSMIVTKTVDVFATVILQRKEFAKFKRERIYNEIDSLRDEVGIIYELSSNWQPFQAKEKEYMDVFIKRNAIVGKFNKYPSIANTARSVLHWSTLVASDEREHGETHKSKEELHSAFIKFNDACDTLLKSI